VHYKKVQFIVKVLPKLWYLQYYTIGLTWWVC